MYVVNKAGFRNEYSDETFGLWEMWSALGEVKQSVKP